MLESIHPVNDGMMRRSQGKRQAHPPGRMGLPFSTGKVMSTARDQAGRPRQAGYCCCIGLPISTPQSGMAGVWTIADTSAVTRIAGTVFIITVPVPV